MSNNNGNMPAMPFVDSGFGQCKPEAFAGLTKREMMAMHFMSSWITHHGIKNYYGFSNEQVARDSIKSADALLKELAK